MTSDHSGSPASPDAGGPDPDEHADSKPFRFTDKRKIDPQTGQVRPEAADAAIDPAELLAELDFEPSSDATGDAAGDAAVLAAQAEAAEHLEALQRERASFTNFRNRALRDQEQARIRGLEDVLTGLLPVLDDIDRARQAGELSGPFEAISDKLDGALAKFGIERYGAVGDEFDPLIHEALMHTPDAEATVTVITIVIEPGYRIGDKVVRAARVSVTGPQ